MKDLKPIGGLLRNVLEELNLWDELQQCHILRDWDDIVGEKIAPYARPFKFENGELWIRVEDSIWRSEIFNIREALLATINEKLGERTVRKIWIK